jgi:hypothetical protein
MPLCDGTGGDNVKSVAIIGGATPKLEAPIPWEDPDWERWCCNALYSLYPTEALSNIGKDFHSVPSDIDKDLDLLSDELGYGEKAFPITGWFQLHTPEYMRRHWSREFPMHELWLERPHDFPIYMQKKYRQYPASEKFPRRLVESLPRGTYQIFSFSWMFCLALAQGAERIGLFGCGAGPGEPLAARACMEYWIGYAEGQGIEVILSGTPTLFRSVHEARMYSNLQYAYDDEPAFELGNGWRDIR